MFCKLFHIAKANKAWPRKTVESKPHAMQATLSWSAAESSEIRSSAEVALKGEILLAEQEQKILKLQGDVAQVIRRKQGRYFDDEKTLVNDNRSSSSSSDSMIDDKGEDWSSALVWADGLLSSPLELDDDERESLSTPDWAVSTTLEAMNGNYKPVVFDWLERPALSHLTGDDNEFSLWCESLADSAFNLDDESEDELFPKLDLSLLSAGDSAWVKFGKAPVEKKEVTYHAAPREFEGLSAVVRDFETGDVIPQC